MACRAGLGDRWRHSSSTDIVVISSGFGWGRRTCLSFEESCDYRRRKLGNGARHRARPTLFARQALGLRKRSGGAHGRARGSTTFTCPISAIPANVDITSDLAPALDGAEIVLGVMPSHLARGLYQRMLPGLNERMMFVSATKGLENDTLLRISRGNPGSRWNVPRGGHFRTDFRPGSGALRTNCAGRGVHRPGLGGSRPGGLLRAYIPAVHQL